MDIKKLVKPNIRSLRAYQAKEIPCRIKLDANESPYGFKAFKSLKTNRYPDPEARALKKLIARDLKVKPEQILVGNGSDELIYYLIMTFGGPVLYPAPTFSMYGIISQALGEKKIEIPLDKNFDLDERAILKEIKKKKPKLIFLSSPNNPTGNSFSSKRILKIIKFTSSLAPPVKGRGPNGTLRPPSSIVVVDEAYQAFSGKKSFLPLLKKYKNLVVLNTFSKIGLAGLRVGYMTANTEIIEQSNKVRLPFNLNSLSQEITVKTLKNRKLLRSYIRTIVAERKKLLSGMKKIKDIRPYPSDANFILFKIYPVRNKNSNGAENADALHKKLLKQGVLIRNMQGIVDNCLRVTVGTPEENTIFLKNLKKLL
ncbi:MAG TPA: aminotransferase class I/II-fold pyridoxal phosphate-dependent enzyme [Nitrospirae bacterium]|nr:histidinol-phosphate aminotransferase 2 [bacterium BMS3Abin10]GBE39895.1 histidinol-phosphate aminotransferase 2 [bacterium BMS3Bbin08]HDO25559.1 aminotransferase class I/II-fold pyridoxal phosphate-dependent enzyme [Nitrospirota bacterium]